MPPERTLGAVRRAPTGHALARLRWSSYQVTNAENLSGRRGRQEHALRTFSQNAYRSLQIKRRCACFLCTILWSSFVALHWNMFFEEEFNRGVLSYVIAVYCTLASLFAVQLYAAWFSSLLLAASLATDAVNDLRGVVANYSPARGELSHGLQYRQDYKNGNWYEIVQRPCLELANGTLPSLSAWGGTIAMMVVACWSSA